MQMAIHGVVDKPTVRHYFNGLLKDVFKGRMQAEPLDEAIDGVFAKYGKQVPPKVQLADISEIGLEVCELFEQKVAQAHKRELVSKIKSRLLNEFNLNFFEFRNDNETFDKMIGDFEKEQSKKLSRNLKDYEFKVFANDLK